MILGGQRLDDKMRYGHASVHGYAEVFWSPVLRARLQAPRIHAWDVPDALFPRVAEEARSS